MSRCRCPTKAYSDGMGGTLRGAVAGCPETLFSGRRQPPLSLGRSSSVGYVYALADERGATAAACRPSATMELRESL